MSLNESLRWLNKIIPRKKSLHANPSKDFRHYQWCITQYESRIRKSTSSAESHRAETYLSNLVQEIKEGELPAHYSPLIETYLETNKEINNRRIDNEI